MRSVHMRDIGPSRETPSFLTIRRRNVHRDKSPRNIQKCSCELSCQPLLPIIAQASLNERDTRNTRAQRKIYRDSDTCARKMAELGLFKALISQLCISGICDPKTWRQNPLFPSWRRLPSTPGLGVATRTTGARCYTYHGCTLKRFIWTQRI